MKNLVICFTEEKKNELIQTGCTFLCEQLLNGENAFVLVNNNNLVFDNNEGLIFTDKLSF